MHGGEADAAEISDDFSRCSLDDSRNAAIEDAGEASVLQHAAEPADAAAVSNYGAEVLALAPNAGRDGRRGMRCEWKMINNALGVAPVYTPHRPKPVVELGKRSKG